MGLLKFNVSCNFRPHLCDTFQWHLSYFVYHIFVTHSNDICLILFTTSLWHIPMTSVLFCLPHLCDTFQWHLSYFVYHIFEIHSNDICLILFTTSLWHIPMTSVLFCLPHLCDTFQWHLSYFAYLIITNTELMPFSATSWSFLAILSIKKSILMGFQCRRC